MQGEVKGVAVDKVECPEMSLLCQPHRFSEMSRPNQYASSMPPYASVCLSMPDYALKLIKTVLCFEWKNHCDEELGWSEDRQFWWFYEQAQAESRELCCTINPKATTNYLKSIQNTRQAKHLQDCSKFLGH